MTEGWGVGTIPDGTSAGLVSGQGQGVASARKIVLHRRIAGKAYGQFVSRIGFCGATGAGEEVAAGGPEGLVLGETFVLRDSFESG